MESHVVALLDFEQTLRCALEARDGEKVLALVESRLQALSSSARFSAPEQLAVAEILSRSLRLGHDVLRMIRSDLDDVQRQRTCMGASQTAPVPQTLSCTA